jgi:hypothetical protein
VSNDWINRLVVRGPAKDVETFAKMATDPRILGDQFDEPSRRRQRLGLSFNAFLNGLPAERRAQLHRKVTEPWDLSLDPLVSLAGGMVERTYRFMLRHYEPDALLTEVSKQYPHLCFVLGWVEPNVDDQASRFIHAGHSFLYRLPEKRKRVLQAAVPADGTAPEDKILSALIEADWAMLDAVLSHWNRKATSVLRRIRRSASRHGRAPRRNRNRVCS